MAARCQQTIVNLIACTKRYLSQTFQISFDYIGYSIQNNKIKANLSWFHSIIDDRSVLVTSNHTWILTTKLSSYIRHFLESGKSKRHFGGSVVTEYSMSKALDLVVLLVKSIGPGHIRWQNCWCLSFMRLQLYLVTWSLFFNAKYEILYQNRKPHH